MSYEYKKIVIKIGSNVLSGSNGLPDLERMAHLVSQMATLKQQGMEIILVSSGAVAAGRSVMSVPEKTDAISARQLLAAVGQVRLINQYAGFFSEKNIHCAQVLVTKEDFRDRKHYLNMKNCFGVLLQNKVLPIVNENDVVSVTELMFTDNDELAGLVATMLNADALIILSNVDGIFTGDPKLATSSILEEIGHSDTQHEKYISTGKSQFGRGGMITKTTMAQKVAKLGIPVHIANGSRSHVLEELLNGTLLHTRFTPRKTASGTKKWIAQHESRTRISVQVNEGARKALLSGKATSLLPIGITSIPDDFEKGDIIRVVDENNILIGLGIAQYGSDKAREHAGQHHQRPLIHYDYFYAAI